MPSNRKILRRKIGLELGQVAFQTVVLLPMPRRLPRERSHRLHLISMMYPCTSLGLVQVALFDCLKAEYLDTFAVVD